MSITQNTDGYCTAVEVSARTGRTYSTSTVPTTAQVETWVKERARTLNATLKARGYDVPIDVAYTESSQVLKALNCLGAAVDADNAFGGMDGSSGRSKDWLTEWRDGVKMLKDPTFELPDAPRGTSTLLPIYAQVPSGQARLDSSGDEEEPIFEMDTKW